MAKAPSSLFFFTHETLTLMCVLLCRLEGTMPKGSEDWWTCNMAYRSCSEPADDLEDDEKNLSNTAPAPALENPAVPVSDTADTT